MLFLLFIATYSSQVITYKSFNPLPPSVLTWERLANISI